MRLLTAEEISRVDGETIKTLGIPGIVLMENAARSVCKAIYNEMKGNSVVVICGTGNNGGDGLATARNLYNMGYNVEVVLARDIKSLKGNARINAEALSRLPVAIHVVTETERLVEVYSLLKDADFIVDALFGTGLNKPIKGFYRELVELVNKANRPIVSVDIPSGIFSDTGELSGSHITANVTVTFGYPKIAHVMAPACYHMGKVYVADICIPEDIPFSLGLSRYILTLDDVAFTYPIRETMSHKYTYGYLCTIGGSTGKTGAPSMTAMAALRAGVGLSTVVVPKALNDIMEIKLTEVMSIPVGSSNRGYFDTTVSKDVIDTIENGKFSAVALGPGLGTNEETVKFVRDVVSKTTKPLILDADGINAIAGDPKLLKGRKAIITPHIGEFSRLTGLKSAEILKEPFKIAGNFAVDYDTVVVLKSGRTIVAMPDGKVYVNVIGNPGMATAGTGDVLTGIIGALLAMGIDRENAAKFGVFLHSLSGDIAAEKFSQEGMKAWDLIDLLPEAIKKIKKCELQPKLNKPFIASLREIVGV